MNTPAVLGGVLLLAVSALAALPAAAACVGPTLTATVDEGRITVVGEFFGTDCYDTGRPPQGQGPLGEPGRAIQVVVTQNEQQQLLAVADADPDYAFEFSAPLSRLEAGTIEVSATYIGQAGTAFLTTARAEPVTLSAEDAARSGEVDLRPPGHDRAPDRGRHAQAQRRRQPRRRPALVGLADGASAGGRGFRGREPCWEGRRSHLNLRTGTAA